jgi:hypothetical protein
MSIGIRDAAQAPAVTPSNHAVAASKAEDFDGVKGCFLELDGSYAARHIQPGHD